ncbi:PadR family transcriptional regulator [Mycobacterium sp. Y57]|uniref:PadR family transcriptional regulator n=1 Tax=Mycolicibacterium xanthum TaxID=2796469 RepID=UPI001C8560F8|nr:PadR family transcriptional regulator [Mycolicibacterium xanthum]MBX7435377.1 PadR family transcriptional regulator [Mycolicibacterium xanthum]
MVSRPTSTSFALLGLLALRPWTAYQLVAQIRRGAHYFWPRSEAHLYAELKRLMARGHAQMESVEDTKRPRTRYNITPEGLAVLEEWAGEPARRSSRSRPSCGCS